MLRDILAIKSGWIARWGRCSRSGCRGRCWSSGRGSCCRSCRCRGCSRRGCSRRCDRSGSWHDVCIVVNPVDVVTDSSVDVGQPRILAIVALVAYPGDTDNRVRSPVRIVKVHRSSIIALTFH